MSGKAYTMREMKSIVDYLTEHRAFSEIKGRKMWVDFANSKMTNRTWQSLKETFLKRILPDIHNPYYKLTMDQIRSFREGCDVIAKEKNKLEIFEIEDDSSSNAEKETEKPSTSHNNGEATSGEDIKCEKIQTHDRASIDTVIIANCYETDDDLRRVLESDLSQGSDNNGKPDNSTPTKSLRDLITYSEPLTPMLQEVLDDFASENESDGELKMQIVENEVDSDLVITNEEPVIEIFDSDDIIEKTNNTEEVSDMEKGAKDNLKRDDTTNSDLNKDKSTEDNLNKDKSTIDNSEQCKISESDLKKDKSSESNSKKDKSTRDNLKHDKVVDSDVKKDESTENNSKTNRPAEDKSMKSDAAKASLKKDNSAEDNLKKDKATKGSEENEKATENYLNTDKSAEDSDKSKAVEDILEKEKRTENILEKNNAKENKTTTEEKEKDNVAEMSLDKAKDKSDEYEVVDTEEFAQPKVLSLKLRKRKSANEKVQAKKPSKTVKSRAEMYEIVEPEILEKSSSNVPEVDTLSNYAKNMDEIVSSTVSDKRSQNSTGSDTILPNNQEALINSGQHTTEDQKQNDTSKSPNSNEKIAKPKSTRKRAVSQDVESTSKAKKNKLNVDTNGKEKAVSDTDDVVVKKLIKSKLTKSKLELKKKETTNEAQNDAEKSKETTTKIAEKDIDMFTILEDEPSTSKPIIDSSQAAELNPCLKSVSLFAEQFNMVSYVDSESEHETTPAASATDKKKDNKPSTSKANENISLNKKSDKKPASIIDSKNNENKLKKVTSIAMNIDEVVMLKSHSESGSESNKVSSPKNKLPVRQDVPKAQRDKALANVFGFYSGGLKRKKRMSYRKNSAYYQRRDESSFDSSEWTSESESEAYVSPPRGRKNKQSRKYLKPHSARILSLEDEGGLFVMYGKKIYPLVKDGKIIKNYLTYLPESDPEEDESYWKLKYVEERKRVAELKKIVKENKEEIEREKSPILPARTMRLSTSHRQDSPFKNPPNKDSSSRELVVAPEKEVKDVENNSGTTLKITFARNNQEVHVEGHWSHIHPVLAEVVHIFNKDSETTNPPAKAVATKRPSDATSDLSVAVLPSPVDEGIPRIDILEKVNKLETEIFKEIENRALEEDIEQPKEQPESNVTKRRRASAVRKSTSVRSSVSDLTPSSTRSSKRQKTLTDEPKDEIEDPEKTPKTINKKESKTDLKKVKPAENAKETIEAVETSVASKRKTRTPKKDTKEVANQRTTEVKTRPTRKSKPPAAEAKANSSQVDEDPDIRYMFPPTTKTRKSTLNLSKSKDKSKRYMANPPKTSFSPHFFLQDESTQGYQDSDVSPPKAQLRRKRKLSLSTVTFRNKNKNQRVKRKSFPCITEDASSNSSSAFQIIVRRASNSSLKSETYKSDSYQLLFPQNKNVFKPLEKIDENCSMPHDSLHPNNFATVDTRRTLEISLNRINNDFLASASNFNTDGGNSSNVSLPMSPELSIVENLSISKDLINSLENYPTLNEIQANNTSNKVIHNKYLMSQVDVSMPLMQQECGLHESIGKQIKTEPSYDQTKMSLVSDSLMNKIDTVNIEDAPSLSESLDTRLRNLLLESAKKMTMTSIQEEGQNEQVASKNEIQKAEKSKKRCSTPRKKREIKKPKKLPIVDPVVEEEFTESCSFGGRKSCPPAIHVISENFIPKEKSNADKDTVAEKKGRKKKDVIKVKILRPRNKSLQSRSPEVTRNTSKTTVHTDSGINESGLTVQGLNDSIDLIHNHSETCLLANECMGDSVEFIETNSKSIISVNTDSATSPDRMTREQFVFQDCRDFVPDLFSENAQSFRHVDYVPESVKLISDNNSDTVYHSPVASEVSINSLITEDLSDETPSSQPTRWYLLSEDDTSHTNAASRSTPNSVPSSFGSNLKQIFPITCAVPDLSTITEASNDNSRKQNVDSANSTRHDLDSQSMFDNMNSN